MARFTFNLPDIGEGIAEAEIVAWHVKPGDHVEEDTRIADMMTDKATVEMESPVAGTIVEIGGEEGEVLAIGSPLVVIETDGAVPEEVLEENLAPAPKSDVVQERIEVETPDASDVEDAAAAVSEPTSAHAEPVGLEEGTKSQRSSSSSSSAPVLKSGRSASGSASQPTSSSRADTAHKTLASPAVRKRAKDLGIDLAQIRPQTGDRIRHSDLDAFVSYTDGFAGAAATRPDEQIKVIGMRRRIAENMAASKRNIPHFTYVEECDVTALEAMRADLNAAPGERPKLTMLPLFITAICRALPDFPMINARYDDEANIVTRHGAVHMGMAAMTEAGLMVPVIRDAQSRNLWQLAREIERLAEAARSGKAKTEELSGSTITLSSLGKLGGVASTPVVNRPEVAIIAPNRIVERPAFVPDGTGGERIEKRKLMNLSISCDHRVVDGYDAAAFIQAVKALLEAPARILAA